MQEVMETPLADVLLAKAGHMVKPSMSVGGATHVDTKRLAHWGHQDQSSTGAGLEAGSLSRGETMVAP